MFNSYVKLPICTNQSIRVFVPMDVHALQEVFHAVRSCIISLDSPNRGKVLTHLIDYIWIPQMFESMV